jgi:hypothetical protein
MQNPDSQSESEPSLPPSVAKAASNAQMDGKSESAMKEKTGACTSLATASAPHRLGVVAGPYVGCELTVSVQGNRF